MKKQKVLAITGPSASGKTSLAVNIAKKLKGEIISADSRLIYKELNIGTAKPTLDERKGIFHHLIDIKEVTEEYTVAEFQDDAAKAINLIINEGKVPIIAGGTGLYFRTLLQDFDLPRVAPNKELRQELEKKTSKELHRILSEKDPDISKKIHENNKVKIIRALEVCLSLGIPMSEAQMKKESIYDVLWIGLNSLNRDFIYDKINQRVDNMFEQGLEQEAKCLFEKYGPLPLLLNTIGYQEFAPYFNGESSLEEVKDLIKTNTRRYAKRQISWFNPNKNINWYNIDEADFESITEDILNKWNKFIEYENC